MASLDFISQVSKSIETLTDAHLAPSDLGLTNCDREPIHIPSAIQSHGVLLTFTQSDLEILQISDNSEVFLGHKPADLLGKKLSVLMETSQVDAIRSCIDADFENVNPLQLSLQVSGKIKVFEGIVHQCDGVIVLELERFIGNRLPANSELSAVSFFDFYKFVKKPIDRIQNTQTLAELAQQTVSTIRMLTGFDRVMMYRWDDDNSGQVIAEDRAESVDSFLGLHYPASDIPKQARELYRLNLLRIIPDVAYEPVALIPAINPATAAPLDLSLSVLRSVSPMHTEYLQNMGVKASMSISLLRIGGANSRHLWGLIACHHYQPKQLSYEMRTICEFLGQVISFEIGAKADAEDVDYKMQLQTAQSRFVDTIAKCQDLEAGISNNPDALLDLVGATGAVFCQRSRVTTFGSAPPATEIAGLLDWIDDKIGQDAVYSTDSLTSEYPEFAPYKDVASGLLALRISRIQQIYLLWFRPEVIQTINWGGEPNKPVTIASDNSEPRLTPRKSFELWKETVGLKSLRWKTCEIEAALELRSRIIGIVLQKADELAILNAELERSNIELDSFAYIASHDLKEPLRGIHNYSTFLIEDYGDQLGADGANKLETLMRLTQRMEDLINSLLHYSRCGRAELQFQPVDLPTVIESVLDTIAISQPSPADIQMPRALPTVLGDRSQLTELFTNLISNALKYNDRDPKSIEIGYILPEEMDELQLPAILDRSQIVFFVKDNGIGIRAKHLEHIFKIFKRLHPASKYGGGTGAGLTIAKKIVERHGGNITVISTFGEGSTFYFTLGERL